MHERDWYRTGRMSRTARSSETWRAVRGLAIIAIAVMAALVFGKNMLRPGGVIATFGDPISLSERRASQREPTRVVIEPAPQRTSTPVYRCIVDGVLVYSGPEDCRSTIEAARPQGTADNVAATAKTASDGFTPYQREMLRSADARIAREAAAAQAEMQAIRKGAFSASAECSALAAEIVALDASARQPNSGQTQDRIRARRQEVRSRQAALHC